LIKEKRVIPGEKLSVIEEFDSGTYTYLNNDEVRSLRTGEVVPNLKARTINIKSAVDLPRVPQIGDIVIGIVETAQSGSANIKIELINEQYSAAGFSGMLQFDSSGRGKLRRISICKAGDYIKAEVFSTLNSIIHLSIEDPDNGVIQSKCSICGSRVTRFRDGIKCNKCGNIEDRKLSSEFGKI
jgi:exosome complex component CSL4